MRSLPLLLASLLIGASTVSCASTSPTATAPVPRAVAPAGPRWAAESVQQAATAAATAAAASRQHAHAVQVARARSRQRAQALAAHRAAVRRAARVARAAAAHRAALLQAARAVPTAPTRAPRPVAVARIATKVVKAPETYQARGARVLASLHYDPAKLGYRVRFLPGQHGLLGSTTPDNHLVTIYVRSTETDLVLRHSIAHELGHALDFSRSNLVTHSTFLTIRGLPDQGWFGCSGCTDFATPAGDWAETFAYWLAGPGDFRSEMAGPPTAAQLVLLRPLFAL